jgi:hypothetical protein
VPKPSWLVAAAIELAAQGVNPQAPIGWPNRHLTARIEDVDHRHRTVIEIDVNLNYKQVPFLLEVKM